MVRPEEQLLLYALDLGLNTHISFLCMGEHVCRTMGACELDVTEVNLTVHKFALGHLGESKVRNLEALLTGLVIDRFVELLLLLRRLAPEPSLLHELWPKPLCWYFLFGFRLLLWP